MNLSNLNKAWQLTAAMPEPAFESPAYQEANWGQRWGVNNDYAQIKKVLMHRPGKELEIVNKQSVYFSDCDAQLHPEGKWYWLHERPLDIEKMQEEHDNLANILRREGAEVVYVDAQEDYMTPGGDYLTKLIFTRDPVIAIPGGAVILRMAPFMRHGEERIYQRTLANIGMPILGMIRGTGLAEGGGFAMLNPHTALLSISSRINQEGADQLEAILKVAGIRLIRIEMPGWVIHVDGSFVMVDKDTALISPNYLQWGFLEELERLGIKTIIADPDEFWACNLLAVSPGRVIMTKGNERTAETLDKEGIEIIDMIDFSEINRGCGSIHCSTQPLMREYV